MTLASDTDSAPAVMQAQGLQVGSYDLARTARMTSFGLLLYGPAQHYWYRLLDRRFAAKSVSSFCCKVISESQNLGPRYNFTVFLRNAERPPSPASLRECPPVTSSLSTEFLCNFDEIRM